MGAKDKKEEKVAGGGDLDPSSGTRKKEPGVQLLLAEFRRRAKGLDGEDLDREVDRLVERIMERHLKVVPEGLKDEFRAAHRALLESDPTLRAMLKGMRAAAARR